MKPDKRGASHNTMKSPKLNNTIATELKSPLIKGILKKPLPLNESNIQLPKNSMAESDDELIR